MKLNLFSVKNKPATLEVSDALFAGDINLELIAQAVHVYRSNERQGGAKALTRSEVSRTGAKWFKQKGTGNARHGARTAPQFVGGGVAHGPTGMENWKRTLPKKMAKKAVVAALSAHAQSENVSIFADLDQVSGKTKQANEILASMKLTGKVLFVIGATNEAIIRAFGNLDNISVTRAERVNAYELASADSVVIAQPALDILETRLLTPSKKAESVEAAPVAKKAPAKKTARKTTNKTTTEAA